MSVADNIIRAWELAQQGRCGYCGRRVNDELQCVHCGIEWASREDMPLKWKPIEAAIESDVGGDPGPAQLALRNESSVTYRKRVEQPPDVGSEEE